MRVVQICVYSSDHNPVNHVNPVKKKFERNELMNTRMMFARGDVGKFLDRIYRIDRIKRGEKMNKTESILVESKDGKTKLCRICICSRKRRRNCQSL